MSQASSSFKRALQAVIVTVAPTHASLKGTNESPPIESSITFNRVLLLRHIALCCGAWVAYERGLDARSGGIVLAVVAGATALNLACSFCHRFPSLARKMVIASPVVGVVSWSMLAAHSGGIDSPLLAGLWLEIVLAPALFSPMAVAMVTVSALVSLWVLQALDGFAGRWQLLMLHSGLIFVAGAVSAFVGSRVQHAHAGLIRERDALGERLERLEDELDAQSDLVGVDSTSQLAHSLKNTVHCLRGFASLIEGSSEGSNGRSALEGLRASIDELEELARLNLDRGKAGPRSRQRDARCHPQPAVERALKLLAVSHPDARFSWESDDAKPELSIADEDLVEVLTNLLTNSVEAAGAAASGSIQMRQQGGEFSIEVRDSGPGIPTADLQRIFEPGFTTKPLGSGYGLSLSRQTLKRCGGELLAHSNDGPGMSIEVRLPVVESSVARPNGAEATRTADGQVGR